ITRSARRHGRAARRHGEAELLGGPEVLSFFQIPNVVDLSTTGARSPVDVPPLPRTEGHFIKKLFMVVAASLLGSTRRRRHRVLAMRLLFVLQWSSDHLTY